MKQGIIAIARDLDRALRIGARRFDRALGTGGRASLASALVALPLAVLLAATQAFAQPAAWQSAWTVSHGARQTTPATAHSSIRMYVRPSISGGSVRVKFENTLGLSPVSVSAAYFGADGGNGSVVAGTNTQLRFSGQPGFKLAPGGSIWSDPLNFSVTAFNRYAVSIDTFYASDISTHNLGIVTNYIASGAHAADPSNTGYTAVPNASDGFPFFWLAAVDVASATSTGTIVTLGDSITDGRCSTRTLDGGAAGVVLPDIYNRWSDILATRLTAANGNRAKAVANEGIAGNRIVSGGNGPPALARLDRDVLERSGATHVIFFEGTNDISGGASAQTVITGSQQVIDRVHAKGLKIIGVTVIPRGGSAAWTNSMEQQRVQVNAWMRNQALFDGLIDFDALMAGPVNPANNAVAMKPEYSCFDGIHPNPTGYQAMGAFIDLNLFN